MVSNWLHNIALVTDSWYTVLSLITFVDKRELTVNKHIMSTLNSTSARLDIVNNI